MAFPTSPTNGQIAIVGGVAYQYATTTNSWSRVVSTANVITANVITVDTLTANTLNVNNSISATGNVTGNYILGNGSLLTGIAGGGGTSIANGTSNITIASSGGNATVNIGGTANVAVFATSGEYVTGVVSASGNVTGGNLLTGGLISATGTLSVTGATTLTTVSTGNISAGNVYSGGSITTGGLISAVGNVTGSYFIGNGSQLTGVTAGAPTSVVNGTSNVVVASSGNVTVGVAGTPNVAVFATTGEYVTGLISATGNVTANNGMFTNIVNVASHTGAVVSVTGNITGGNVSGTALTGTLATAVQTNITSVGTLGALAVSGNVTAGNVTAGSGVSVPSGSVLFNGTTQVLTVPDNAVFEMSGDFTIEFWFYITATPVGFDTVLSKGAAGVFQPYYFTFNSSTTLLFYSSSSGSSWDVASAVSMGAVSLNVWNTAAVSRSSTAMRLFLNGALVTTITNGSALYNNANAVGIGGRGDVSELFTGYVSTVRIVKGVAVYTSAYTPATAPLSSTQSANQNGNPSAAITGTSTSLLLNTANGAGFLTDSSTNNFTVTNTGTATSNSLAPFVNTSGTVTATDGVFTGNLTAAGILTVNSGAAATAIVNGAGNAVGNIGSSGTYFNRLFAQATTALYADLAEVYKADAAYPPGTVLVFGGDQEVTVSTSSHDTRIAGVVSTNPAHVMNSGLVSEFTVEVGLIGRVPCQVIGPVAVGDRVVSSNRAGVAERLDMQHYQPGVIIGKAVESYNGTGVGTIEVVVGRL